MGYLRNLGSALVGRPVAMAPTSGYNAATNGRRMLMVGTSTRGASSLALADGQMLCARARKAYQDNMLCQIGVRSFVTQVIGNGMKPHSQHSNDKTRRLLEREFELWTAQSSANRKIGPGGKPDSLQSFYDQQRLIAHNVIVAGESFARLRYRLSADLSPLGLRVPLQVDLIEPEQLAYWRMSGEMSQPTNLIRGGIEFDQIHQKVAYHFYREHPGDSTLWPNAFEVVRVPAKDILHVIEFLAGNQIRGVTPLAPIILALSDLADYEDSERFRQKLASHLFAWRETQTPDDVGYAGSTSAGNDTAPDGTEFVESQPGQVTVFNTNVGEKMSFYAAPGVPGTYDVFMRGQKQQLSADMRVTYDMLTGDNSSTTFMNARVRLNDLKRGWAEFQAFVLAHQFCRPLWRAWLDAAALVGIIDAKDYAKNPEEYLAVDWIPDKHAYVDPVKDRDAERMDVESCFTSRSRIVKSRGGNVEDVDAAIAADHAREARLRIAPIYGASRAMINEPAGDNPDNGTPAKPEGKP